MALLQNAAHRRRPGQGTSLTRGMTARTRGLQNGVLLVLCVAAWSMLACQSESVIAAWSCPQPSEATQLGSAGAAGSGGSSATGDAFPQPWSTGFENGWCDFADGRGAFADSGERSKEVVTEPVHSGSFAAAFTINSANPGQMRCMRQGSMPSEAKYGAWYYIPALAKVETPDGIWNLFHFQGDNELNRGHLWDISLVNLASGALRLEVFNYWVKLPDQSKAPPIPIGAWFHIEMYWKRAADDTGEVIVYQDGVAIFQVANVQTDNSDSMVQWYVGNYAHLLDPVDSTVYVDDVTID